MKIDEAAKMYSTKILLEFEAAHKDLIPHYFEGIACEKCELHSEEKFQQSKVEK